MIDKDNIYSSKKEPTENSADTKNDEINLSKNKKKPFSGSRALALSCAVAMTLSITIAGCGTRQDEDEEDDSYYYGGGGGGSYFYAGTGASYRRGSWGDTISNTSSKSGYSSIRGGSVGG